MRNGSPRRTRLLRTAALVTVVVGAGALAVRLFGDGGGVVEPPTPEVAFAPTVEAVAQGTTIPSADEEGAAITAMLNRWYQDAFVDPKSWGDGTFPQVMGLFVEEARADAERDLASLTIGEARTELKRVDDPAGAATITLYFDDASRAQLAVAHVTFTATGTMRDGAAPPLAIEQSSVLHLRKEGGSWLVFSYEASQKQESVLPSPSPSP